MNRIALACAMLDELPHNTGPAWPVRTLALVLLVEERGCVHMAEICRMLDVRIATAHEMVADAVAAGLVQTERPPTNKRLTLVTLTTKALQQRTRRRAR